MDELTTSGSNFLSASIVNFGIPDDKDLLAAIGVVALRHSLMDHMLRLTIKSLGEMPLLDAMDETEFLGSKALRGEIDRLAKSRLGEGAALNELRALLGRCKDATEKRNRMIHDVWFYDPITNALRRTDGIREKEIPTVATLNALAAEILQLAHQLSAARDGGGFLAIALAAED